MIASESFGMRVLRAGSLKQALPPRLRVAWRALNSLAYGEPELRLLPSLCDRRALSIDVGANTGVYTWHLARLSAEVLAFEPQAHHAQFLRQAFGRSVGVEQVALSSRAGEAILRVPMVRYEDGRATIEPGNALGGRAATECRVPMCRLDDYDLSSVRFVKIDVEGHELDVLQGAARLLARDRPDLLIEVEDTHRPSSVAATVGHLEGYGYRAYFLKGGRLHGLLKASGRAALPPGRFAAALGVYNLIFLTRPCPARLAGD